MHQKLENPTFKQRFTKALANKELKLYYQAIINPQDSKLLGAEALIRWEHCDEGLLYPSRFIHKVFDYDVSMQLDLFVIQTAVEQIKIWQEQGFDIPKVHVNLSLRQLMDKRLCQRVVQICNHHGVDLSKIMLEVTESQKIDYLEEVKERLNRLRDLGARVSIDDFGEGYTSLKLLKHIDFDEIKLDRSFIRQIATVKDKILISKLFEICECINTTLLIEGVETEEQHNFISDVGIKAAQGFFYHRPSSVQYLAEDLKKILNPSFVL